MEVADEKTGVVIASMRCNFDTSRIKKEIKKQMLEDYCCDHGCYNCIFTKMSPCIMRLIELEEATDEQINECCRKIGDDEK